MTQDTPRPGFATRAIHAGQDADPATGATVVPIYATSTYTQEAPGSTRATNTRSAATSPLMLSRIKGRQNLFRSQEGLTLIFPLDYNEGYGS
jgi:cystathionine beta-lyase/cystathionine gamma-synthase